MARKSTIIKIRGEEIKNASGCLLSGEYKVYYSSGVKRCFYLRHLTPEMHKFLVKSVGTGKSRVIAVSKLNSRNNYTVITDYIL